MSIKNTNYELARIMNAFKIDNVDVANYLDVPISIVNSWIDTDIYKCQIEMPETELRRLIQILMMENIRLLHKN